MGRPYGFEGSDRDRRRAERALTPRYNQPGCHKRFRALRVPVPRRGWEAAVALGQGGEEAVGSGSWRWPCAGGFGGGGFRWSLRGFRADPALGPAMTSRSFRTRQDFSPTGDHDREVRPFAFHYPVYGYPVIYSYGPVRSVCESYSATTILNYSLLRP